MKLIADSGSTKTHWYLTKKNILREFETIGLNPVVLETTEIAGSLKEEVLPKMQDQENLVTALYFYGAGCSSALHVQQMQECLQKTFPNAKEIQVCNDLWASIYASCSNQPGIACILGTGSNACVFDGQTIVDRLPSLGYMLGDEGSGNQIGKSLLRSFFYREMPRALAADFQEVYALEEHDFVEKLYESARPNRLLASYAKFASKHRQQPFIQKLLENCFEGFVQKQLLKFSNYQHYPIHFIGSIAAVFEEELTKVLKKYTLNKGNVLKSPFPKLLDYHQGKL